MTSTNGTSSSLLVDELLTAHPLMRVKDKPRVEGLLKSLIDGGVDKLQLVVDFDHTLTRTKNEKGQTLDCSWGVLENSPLLSEDYTKECGAIKAHYLPIEHDPHMSIEEKIPHMVEWYTKANLALQRSGVHKSDFSNMVKASNVDFREGSNQMLSYLLDAGIPVLVLSAGVGDLIVEILKAKGAHHSNLKVVSNFLAYDNDGNVTGLDGEMIHVYNKNENAIHDSDYFKVLQSRHNVILLGDSLGDLHMADGIENPEAVLKIGFLNANIEERLDNYMNLYDIVLMDDQTMNLPFQIIKKIGQTRN
jgi:5'-nucleotidase